MPDGQHILKTKYAGGNIFMIKLPTKFTENI
jgi:hypothetical protein